MQIGRNNIDDGYIDKYLFVVPKNIFDKQSSNKLSPKKIMSIISSEKKLLKLIHNYFQLISPAAHCLITFF